MNRFAAFFVLSAGGILLMGWTHAVSGQSPYTRPPSAYAPGYPGYYPGGYYPGAVGGALQGQASVINAQGEFMIQTEQARQEREKANQEKLVTKKKSFDEMMYEKANTPTLTENLQYDQGLMTQRMMTSPTPTEITSGKTLNMMLPMIKDLAVRGTIGPPIQLDPAQLKEVNVTVGKGGVNLGMLKDGGSNLPWPFSTRGPQQKKLAQQIPTAVSQTKSGDLDPTLYREITKGLSQMKEDLRTKFHKEEIDGGEFLEANRFLDPLIDSVQALRQPTSQRFLDGSYTAKGNTVPELAQNMVKNGLSFTACNPGEEAAYYALHDHFVAYTQSAEAAAGYQVKYTPPRTEPWQVKALPK